MSNLNGFIKLHRKLVAWGWYKDDAVKSVFIHLLLTASFRDTPWRDITLKKGQLVTSYQGLADDIGHSVQEVRTAIKKLKSTGEITTEATSKYTIVTVVNWEDYQLFENISTSEATSSATSSATNNQQTTNKQPTNNQQHRKNIKNIKNNKKEINKEKSSPSDAALAAAGLTREQYEELRNQ